MDEKTMFNDVLESIKLHLMMYQNAINDTENIELRQILQQIRNTDESYEYELLKIAKVKDYYKFPILASEKEIQKIKVELE